MGVFNVTVGVGHPGGGDMTEVSAIVDTGAYHTMLPKSLLRNFGYSPMRAAVLEIMRLAAYPIVKN